jgi:2-methylcitrate dehydratase PrpD
MTAGPQLAAFAASLTWGDLDSAVQDRTAELVLDFLGVTAGGTAAPSSLAAARLLDGDRRPGACTVIGRRGGYLPEMAALINGIAGHGLELDDVTRESSLHPGVAVIPAALAAAEEVAAPLAELGKAIVAGYEVTIRVGNALGAASMYRRGFHPTGVAGVFGAATAAGLLLGLDAPGLVLALGIAGSFASGSLEYLADGSWTKRLNAGWAAHGGVIAAQLAKAGFTGPASGLDGQLGVLNAYTDDARPKRLLDGLGDELAIMTVAIKPYACCRYNHGLIDAMLAIRGQEQVAPRDVRCIRLGVLSAGALLVADPIEQKRRPRSVVDAQFSAPYAAAVALVYGRAGVAEYTEQMLDDARLRELMAKTECFVSGDLDAMYPQRWPAEVVVELEDGTTFRRRVEYALGEPENPVPRVMLVGKFAELAATIGITNATAERVLAFEEAAPVIGLLRPFRRSTNGQRRAGV